VHDDENEDEWVRCEDEPDDLMEEEVGLVDLQLLETCMHAEACHEIEAGIVEEENRWREIGHNSGVRNYGTSRTTFFRVLQKRRSL